jgi:threonine/homoserine/homoserine lactone efflux protein
MLILWIVGGVVVAYLGWKLLRNLISSASQP